MTAAASPGDNAETHVNHAERLEGQFFLLLKHTYRVGFDKRTTPDLAARQIVREVSYAGDEGGILRHIEPNGS